MNIAFVTHYDIFNSNKWHPKAIGFSGTSYYKAEALKERFTNFEYIGPLTERHSLRTKFKRRLYKYLSTKAYYDWAALDLQKNYARQINTKLSNSNSQLVVCPDISTIAYVECQQPIVLWTTNTYGACIDFYDDFSNLCRETIDNLVTLDRLALSKVQLAVFPSTWAAEAAMNSYQIDRSKVEIVPYGANIECDRTIDDIQNLVEARTAERCKLLFLGVSWYRKGGDIALKVAKKLKQLGIDVELTVVGCQPITDEPLPDYVVNVGFIKKSDPEGSDRLNQLISDSHFLILPSRAETYGNVLCEANSFGVPCLTTKVGGIPSIIQDNVNGKLFALNADVKDYCEYVAHLFTNYAQYKQLAYSSFHEYETRLNWSAAGKSMQTIITEKFS
ncbi:group 1 glycosyl transferase [Cyanosarcina cf. burmensis CCALA 770]|jgi:glycosyltransferase involved in cell wall biosynthesis|nr:group 1 glycosyl transferase [Cyanosarcina cf. burmensis CCALA 770]